MGKHVFEPNFESIVQQTQRVAKVKRTAECPISMASQLNLKCPGQWIRWIAMVIILSLLIFSVPSIALADGPENGPGNDFWKRYNHVYDIGRNYLDDTARGSGRVSPHHGAYNYRYDIPLPPGRNGVPPDLSLIYSSQGGRSYLGEGWSWNIPYIERSTRYGIPSYTEVGEGADQLDYHDENGSVHHLIPVQQQGDHIYYRFMSESEFSWFKYNTSTKIWTVLRKDGRHLEFGNPYSEACTNVSGRGRTAWYLNEDQDATGNTIQYVYSNYPEDFIVPFEIIYTGNIHKEGTQGWEPVVKVRFSYSAGSKRILDCRIGICSYVDEKQLDRIDVKVNAGYGDYDLRKQFFFHYDAVDYHKVLYQIRPRASDEDGSWTALPPVTFTYEQSTPAFVRQNIYFPQNDPQPPYWEHSQRASPGQDYGMTHILRTLADMNGDGIKDLVIAHKPRRSEFCQYKIYFGNVSQAAPSDLSFSGPEYWDIPQRTQLYSGCQIRMIDTSPTRSRKVSDLLDVTGDGLPDYVRVSVDDLGQSVLLVARNSGDRTGGFSDNDSDGTPDLEEWPLPSGLTSKEIYWEEPYLFYQQVRISLVDMNGDGLPDIVDCFRWENNNAFQVYLNQSSGFSQSPVEWYSPVNSINTQFLGINERAALGLIELSDMNGDSLPGLVVQWDWGSYNDPIRVCFNIGDGFAARPVDDWNLPGPTSLSAIIKSPNNTSTYSYIERHGVKFLVDVNGDSLPDYLIRYSEDQGESWKWGYYQNLGTEFASTHTDLVGLPGFVSADGTVTIQREEGSITPEYITNQYSLHRLTDIDGDGKPDLVFIPDEDQDDLDEEYDHFIAYMGDFHPSLKLVRIENGYGGAVEIEYTPSSRTTNPHLPAVSLVVSSVETFDGFENTHRVTYSYEDGLIDSLYEDYFHPANKEFRGFSTVEEIDLTRDLLVERRYHQDAYRDGFLRMESHSRLSNRKLILREITSFARKVIESHPLWNSISVLFYYPQSVWNYACNEEPECTSTGIFQQFDLNGNLTYLYDRGVHQRNGRFEYHDDRRFFWGYKSRTDLENNVYIFAPEYTESHSRDDNGWVRDSSTYYYHDGSSSRDHITQGLPTKIRRYTAPTTYYESIRSYDTESGLLLSETDFNGNETTYVYDRLTNTYVATKRSGGLKEEFDWDTAIGENTSYRDPNGVLWYYEYDGFGRLRRESYEAPSRPLIERKRIVYGDWWYYYYGTPVVVYERTTIDQDQPLSAHRRSYYNGLGNKVLEDENHDLTHRIIRYFGYDAAGRLKKISEPIFWEVFDLHPDWTHVDHSVIHYDPLDRVTEIYRPCNSNGVRTFSFGGDLSTTMVDEEGNRLSTLEDAQGNILEVIHYDSSGNPVKSVFEYDGHDNIIKATDPLGNEINYVRDWLGRIGSVRLPGLPEGKIWTFKYDGKGNMIHFLSPAGREISYTYDALDRVSYRELKMNGTLDGSVEYNYDRPTGYGKGRLTFADSAGGLASYFYDPRGNILEYSTENRVSNNRYELAFIYNEADEIKSVTYPDGSIFRYTYNPDGTVKALIRESDGVIIAEATYNARRQITSITTDFGVSYSFSYDACSRPRVVFSHSGSNHEVIMNRWISYYQNDKVRTIRDGEEIGWGDPTEFHYDTLLRLQSAVGEAYAVSYEYDWADRLKHMDRDGHSVDFLYEDTRFPWAVTSVNYDSATTGYAYDDDGIIRSASTSIGEVGYPKTTSFAFDARGLIESATTMVGYGYSFRMAWEYDHLDRPVHAAYSGICLWPGCPSTDYVDRYYENENQPGIGGRATKYLFFAGRRIAAQVKETSLGPEGPYDIEAPYYDPSDLSSVERLYYLHADQIGSIRYVTDRRGNVVDIHRYYPYGEEYQTSGSTGVDFGFNDRKREGYGLYRFPMRMYNPSGHQWMSLDPAMFTNPSVLILNGVNPFAYVGNDPMNRTDASGLQYELEWEEIQFGPDYGLELDLTLELAVPNTARAALELEQAGIPRCLSLGYWATSPPFQRQGPDEFPSLPGSIAFGIEEPARARLLLGFEKPSLEKPLSKFLKSELAAFQPELVLPVHTEGQPILYTEPSALSGILKLLPAIPQLEPYVRGAGREFGSEGGAYNIDLGLYPDVGPLFEGQPVELMLQTTFKWQWLGYP